MHSLSPPTPLRHYEPPSDYPFPEVFTGFSPHDTMLCEDRSQHYYEVGLSAARCIETVFGLAGRSGSSPARILDMPCGHGRVARVLRARFPEAALTVCDLDREAVDLCATHFRAQGVYSTPNFRGIALTGPFDLIWVGSLITHLTRPATERFLRFACSLLAPDGLLVCSSHGSYVAGWLRDSLETNPHRVPVAAARKALADYERVGYGFFANRRKGWRGLAQRLWPDRVYGTSLIARDWLMALPLPGGCRLDWFLERAWADNHDILVVRRDGNTVYPVP